MTDLAPASWVREIRDYLIGRTSAAPRIERLHEPQSDWLVHAPIRRWWTFEGKHYATLGGTLGANANVAVRIARRLNATFNPRVRLSERPEGEVDWAQTLARGPQTRPEYVLRSSGLGLGEAEREALRGWARWVRQEWQEYFGPGETSANLLG